MFLIKISSMLLSIFFSLQVCFTVFKDIVAMNMFKKILGITVSQQSVIGDMEIIFHKFFTYIRFTYVRPRSLFDLRATI